MYGLLLVKKQDFVEQLFICAWPSKNESILKQQRQGRLTPESDRRGKQQNRPNKCTDEDI